MIKVGFDAGHGLNTPGKRTPDDEREWSFNDQVARAFANELALYKGVMTKRFDDPTGKRDVPLAERTNGANSWKADYYISFHHNALSSRWGDHTGVETFVYLNPTSASIRLAESIHPALVKGYGLHDRGIKRANLHIVRETTMPSILIEGGFMDSRIDIKKLRDPKVLVNVGKLIAQNFAKFAQLSKTTMEGDLTMAQYEELKRLINAQAKRIEVLETLAGVTEREVSEVHRLAWEWATAQGYMDGTLPNRPLTREQFATVQYRIAQQQQNSKQK